jgi:hypothetical protein
MRFSQSASAVATTHNQEFVGWHDHHQKHGDIPRPQTAPKVRARSGCFALL